MARVLVVEDDPTIQHAYQFVLQKAGFTVDVARNGQEALTLMGSLPDCIILDMLMPGFSGLDFLRTVGLKEHYPNMQVFAVSNIDSPKIKEEALSLGVRQYLIKVGITPDQLVQLVKGALAPEAN